MSAAEEAVARGRACCLCQHLHQPVSLGVSQRSLHGIHNGMGWACSDKDCIGASNSSEQLLLQLSGVVFVYHFIKALFGHTVAAACLVKLSAQVWLLPASGTHMSCTAMFTAVFVKASV